VPAPTSFGKRTEAWKAAPMNIGDRRASTLNKKSKLKKKRNVETQRSRVSSYSLRPGLLTKGRSARLLNLQVPQQLVADAGSKRTTCAQSCRLCKRGPSGALLRLASPLCGRAPNSGKCEALKCGTVGIVASERSAYVSGGVTRRGARSTLS
jgi:hypothetical protein